MRITCPACHATYDVPAAVLARAPARVRCARCAEEWVPEELKAAAAPLPVPPLPVPPIPAPPEPAPPVTSTPFADTLAQVAAQTAPPPDAEPARPPAPPRAEPMAPRYRPTVAPRSPRDSVSLWFAWSMSIGVVAALLAAAYINHADIVAFWPPAERAYMLLGIN